MNKVYCGIDPGMSGAISLYDPNRDLWFHWEMPKIGKFVDTNELNNIFKSIREDYNDIIVGQENVHALYNSSSSSTWNFGFVCGLIEGLIVANGLPLIKIQPKKWQKFMWEGVPMMKKPSSTGKTNVTDTKGMSLMAAKRLYPNMDFRRNERCKVPDDNKVDSILITTYLKRNY